MTTKYAIDRLLNTTEFWIVLDLISKECDDLDKISTSIPSLDMLKPITSENKIIAEIVWKTIAREVIYWLLQKLKNPDKYFKQ